ncbi:MAG: S8 family serine peptidase [Burkholderiales bacterium]
MWRRIALASLLLPAAKLALAAPLPDELLLSMRHVGAVDVIVELDASAIDRSAATRRARLPRRIDDDAALANRASRYRTLKDQAMRPLRGPDIDELLDYSHLPMRAVHVRSEAALRALAAGPGVRAVYPDVEHRAVLAESLPQIGQPAVVAAGYGGNGATVAVIDDGIDRAQAAFGGCSTVGVPASCRVVAEQTFATAPGTDSRHGTNVAAIVAGVAPQARIAALNVFEDTGGAYTSSILLAINWAIANRSTYGIVAINMSLGDASRNAAPCDLAGSNPYLTPISNARGAGIHVVVAAGNAGHVNGAFSAGLASPACTPGAVSVGAVYDANVGGLTWGRSPNQCTDTATQADQITCFSMSSTYLSLLAPGAFINAGGFTLGGTSQAAPHVAGALAVLRSAFAGETLAAAESRLTANGTPILDSRINRSFPRLNLAASARPANDDFAAATALSGASGSAGGSNRLATLQAGEQAPASSAGSVWWTWTAPAAGQVSLSTAGSSFDTRLDVYTGAAVGGLSAIAGNDNANAGTTSSSLRFQAAAGVTYRIAVSGVGGASGDVALGWSLNTAAQANLSVALTGPGSALPGSVLVYTLTVANAGPQSATGVAATLSLPVGLSVDSVAAGCAAQAAAVVCSVSELAAAAQAQFSIALRVDSLAAPVSLSASLVADLPDPVTGNNTTTAPLAPPAGGSGEGDIPTLPEWALLLLGGWLLARIAAGKQPRAAARRR